MRILHVTDSYLPTIGGMERAIRGLTCQRTSEGHAVMVLTGELPDAPRDETDAGVRIMRRPMATQLIPGGLTDPNRPFHATLPDPLFEKAVREAIREHQPDVIHCHGWSRFSAIPVAAKMRVPVVATAHDYGFACATKQGTLPDGTVCTGPSVKKCVAHSLAHYGVKGAPIALGLRAMAARQRHLTATGISRPIREFGSGTGYQPPFMADIPSFVPDEVLTVTDDTKPEWAPDEPYVMFVGALTKYKGLEVLLESQRILRHTFEMDVPLLIIGTPQPDTPAIQRANITVRRNVAHEDVMRAWRHATVGTAPSVWPEGFGQVVVEALAAGTPMIGTNHGGIAEIITHNVDGILVPPNDPRALADAIAELWRDPHTRERLSRAGERRACDFTLSVVGPRFLGVYRQAIDQFQPGDAGSRS